MSIRGQNAEAWCARWRQGTCPVHGVGLVVETQADDAAAPLPEETRAQLGEGVLRVHCPREGCTVRAAQHPGKDDRFSFFGWLAGPDDVHAALVRGGDIGTDGRPGGHARSVRTSWRMEGL